MFPNTVFFGLQYYLKAYLEGPRFTQADIAQADEFCRQHFGDALFNRNGWTRLYEKHHGVLPVRIKAVPEGTVAPLQNVLVTIENTDPEFPWVTNYLPRSMAREEDALHTPPVRPLNVLTGWSCNTLHIFSSSSRHWAPYELGRPQSSMFQRLLPEACNSC
jgi:hypothetical protein